MEYEPLKAGEKIRVIIKEKIFEAIFLAFKASFLVVLCEEGTTLYLNQKDIDMIKVLK